MVDASKSARLGPDFLTVTDAAAYVGTSAQTLRRWDREGRLRAVRHPGNGYRYYRRADLEPFRIEAHPRRKLP